MKRLFFYFLILLAAVWLGLKIQADPGYLLLSYNNWGIETTLWFAVLLLVFAFLAFYCFIRIAHNSWLLPKRIQFWWHGYKERRAIRMTNLGLFKMVEDDFSVAEKRLIKAAKSYPNPFFNFLSAAYAAQKQDAYNRRDHYLSQALEANDKAHFTVGILQAQMQIAANQLEQALATLQHLRHSKARHPALLRMLVDVYSLLGDWRNLRDLLSVVRRRNVFASDQFARLECRVYLEILKEQIDLGRLDKVEKIWDGLARSLRRDFELAFFYAEYLLKHKQLAKAETVLRDALQKTWAPKLLELYVSISSEKPLQQLAYVERMLKTHLNDETLFFCLGKLCKREQLWGKARNYLEKSLALVYRPEAYLELGSVLEIQGDLKAAMEYYKRGLQHRG